MNQELINMKDLKYVPNMTCFVEWEGHIRAGPIILSYSPTCNTCLKSGWVWNSCKA